MQMINELVEAYYTKETVKVSPADLMQTLDSSVDSYSFNEDWVSHIALNKWNHKQMEVLIDSILENGMLTPLNVCYNEWEGKLELGNGNHRFLAAMLCGIEEIEVYVTRYTDWGKSTLEDTVAEWRDQFVETDMDGEMTISCGHAYEDELWEWVSTM